MFLREFCVVSLLSEKARRLYFVKNHGVVLEHFRNLEFLRVIKSRALEMSEIIVTSSSKMMRDLRNAFCISEASKSLDFDSHQNS